MLVPMIPAPPGKLRITHKQRILDPLQDPVRTTNSTTALLMELKLVFMSEFASEISSQRTKPWCMSQYLEQLAES